MEAQPDPAATHLHLDADASDLAPPHPVAADAVLASANKVVGLKGRELEHTHVVAGHALDQQLGLRVLSESHACGVADD